jgi:2,3,4,5-tetrahydropyridine-2-carboxylate N-succinyltransferase
MSSQSTAAHGHGIATLSGSTVLDVWFPAPALGALLRKPTQSLLDAVGADDVRKVRREVVSREIDITQPPQDAVDAYLRLHLLSHRLIKPHGLSLDGIFGLLSNVVWTSAGPCTVEGFEEVRAGLRARDGHVTIFSVIPSGVRIADADRVRLGAHLASGTTVMHEGFVNFNAGTLGTSMVEGRISSGVVVDDGTDVGGGASIMGTLSGGGKQVISIGKKCLLGANSGLGISLGDNCVIEAGTYITAAAKVRLPDGEVVKAGTLSGASNVLFRRNSLDGCLEVVVREGSWGGLNSVLHAN